jgi:hypothetical protein
MDQALPEIGGKAKKIILSKGKKRQPVTIPGLDIAKGSLYLNPMI